MKKKYQEGLNNDGIFKREEGEAMLREQNTGEAGYPNEGMLETEDNKGARSIASSETAKKNGAGNLLDMILDNDNLNTAYQRVKKNGGAAGVDGMTVDEMYPYLREHGRELVTLMIAVLYNKNPEIISILLKNGADVKAKDKYGKRAIDYAREYDKHKNTDAIRELEEAVK